MGQGAGGFLEARREFTFAPTEAVSPMISEGSIFFGSRLSPLRARSPRPRPDRPDPDERLRRADFGAKGLVRREDRGRAVAGPRAALHLGQLRDDALVVESPRRPLARERGVVPEQRES